MDFFLLEIMMVLVLFFPRVCISADELLFKIILGIGGIQKREYFVGQLYFVRKFLVEVKNQKIFVSGELCV